MFNRILKNAIKVTLLDRCMCIRSAGGHLTNRANSKIKIRIWIFTNRSVSLLASFTIEAGRTAAVRLGYVVVVVVIVVLVGAAVGAAHVRLALARKSYPSNLLTVC